MIARRATLAMHKNSAPINSKVKAYIKRKEFRSHGSSMGIKDTDGGYCYY